MLDDGPCQLCKHVYKLLSPLGIWDVLQVWQGSVFGTGSYN